MVFYFVSTCIRFPRKHTTRYMQHWYLIHILSNIGEIIGRADRAAVNTRELLDAFVRDMELNTLTNMIGETVLLHGFLGVRESIVAAIGLAMSSRMGSRTSGARLFNMMVALLPVPAAGEILPNFVGDGFGTEIDMVARV